MSNITGVIGVPCATQGRWSGFWDALLHLETVPGVVPMSVRGPSAAGNRNEITRQALKTTAEWVFYLDDDLLFGPSVLRRLLERNVDAVVGISLQRKAPFPPLIYEDQDDRGWAYPRPFRTGDKGLVMVKAATSGGLLVRRHVLEAMSDPWWTLGQIEGHKDGWGDDLDFCRKLRAAGFTLWCDLDVPFGHITEVVLWPIRRGDNWTTQLVTDVPFGEIPAAGAAQWEEPAQSPPTKKGMLRSWKQ